MFILGLDASGARRMLEQRAYRPRRLSESNPRIARTIDPLSLGRFAARDPELGSWVEAHLLDDADPYLYLADFASYLESHQQAVRTATRAGGRARRS